MTGAELEQEIGQRLAQHYAPTQGLQRLGRIQQLGAELTNKEVWSYGTEEYFTGTAFSYGDDRAAKFKFAPCDGEVISKTPADAGPDYLQEGLKNEADDLCFEVYAQFLDADVMTTKNGEKLEPWQWVEDAGLDWDKAGAPYTDAPLAKLTVLHDTILDADDCDHVGNAYNVANNALPEHRALGGINRGRTRVEKSSQDNRQ